MDNHEPADLPSPLRSPSFPSFPSFPFIAMFTPPLLLSLESHLLVACFMLTINPLYESLRRTIGHQAQTHILQGVVNPKCTQHGIVFHSCLYSFAHQIYLRYRLFTVFVLTPLLIIMTQRTRSLVKEIGEPEINRREAILRITTLNSTIATKTQVKHLPPQMHTCTFLHTLFHIFID